MRVTVLFVLMNSTISSLHSFSLPRKRDLLYIASFHALSDLSCSVGGVATCSPYARSYYIRLMFLCLENRK